MLHVDIQGRATTLAPQLMIRSSRGQKPRPDAGSGAPGRAGQGAAGGFWKEGKQLKQGGVGVEGGRTRVHDATPPSDPCPGLPWSPHRHGLKRGSGSELCQSSVHSGPCRKTSRWLCLQPWMQPALPRRPRVSGYQGMRNPALCNGNVIIAGTCKRHRRRLPRHQSRRPRSFPLGQNNADGPQRCRSCLTCMWGHSTEYMQCSSVRESAQNTP